MEKRVTECWVGLVGPAMRFQEGNESRAWRAKRKLFRRTGKWCSSKFWNYEGQCICLIVAGRREVFPGRVASLRKGCGVGIKMCWGPKRGDLRKWKLFNVGHLLFYLNLIQLREKKPTQERVPLLGTGTQQTQPFLQSYLELRGRCSGSPRSEAPDQADCELPGGMMRDPGSSLFPFRNPGQFQFT